jgi:hypothetical protein
MGTQKVYTKSRGYLPTYKLNDLDVFIDYEGYLCKIIKKEICTKPTNEIFNIDVSYNNNLICSGILIKDNV